MDEFLDDVKSYNTKQDLLLYKNYNALTIAKVKILNKPYIHHIDVKSNEQCQQEITGLTSLTAGLPYNDMFIKMCMSIANKRLLLI